LTFRLFDLRPSLEHPHQNKRNSHPQEPAGFGEWGGGGAVDWGACGAFAFSALFAGGIWGGLFLAIPWTSLNIMKHNKRIS